MKVMLVEEAGVVRLRIAEALSETCGVDLTTCSPDENVYSRVIQSQPDVVILDMHVPFGGALELIRRIKAITPAPVVIALSSTGTIQYRALCHKAGAEYFFDLVREHERVTEAVQELKEELGC